ADVARLKQNVESGALHPKQAKVDLATRIVSDFHGAADASRAAQRFEARFSRGETAAEDLRELVIGVPRGGSVALTKVMVDAGLATSSSEASRKIQQGGVKIDGARTTDIKMRIDADRDGFMLE